MFHPLSILVFVVAASIQGPFQVFWSNREMRQLSIDGQGLSSQVVECLQSSRQARVTFEARICRHEPAWFDSCLPSRSSVQTIEFDAISESYRVVSDMQGDGLDAVAVGIPSQEEAIHAVLMVRSMSIDYLAQGDVTVAKEQGSYIQVRSRSSCRGSSSRFFAHISEILTLGLVDVVESTSDWYEFNLASDILRSPGA